MEGARYLLRDKRLALRHLRQRRRRDDRAAAQAGRRDPARAHRRRRARVPDRRGLSARPAVDAARRLGRRRTGGRRHRRPAPRRPRCSRGCARSAPAASSTTCWRWCSTRRSTSAAPSAASSCSSGDDGALEFKMGRGRGQQQLEGSTFQTSRKIPGGGVRDRATPRLIADLLDGELANVHMGTVALGIRHVLCVPLDVVRYVDDATAVGADRDAPDRRALPRLARARRAAARHRPAARSRRWPPRRRWPSRTRGSIAQALEKAKLEQDIRIAAEIQQALLPKPRHGGAFFETAAPTIPCRSIGGDFYDVHRPARRRARLRARRRGGEGPAGGAPERARPGHHRGADRVVRRPVGDAGPRQQGDDPPRRRGALRDDVLRRAARRRPPGLRQRRPQSADRDRAGRAAAARGAAARRSACSTASPTTRARSSSLPGDRVIVFSDGVSEACNISDEEFSDARIIAVASALTGPVARRAGRGADRRGALVHRARRRRATTSPRWSSPTIRRPRA